MTNDRLTDRTFGLTCDQWNEADLLVINHSHSGQLQRTHLRHCGTEKSGSNRRFTRRICTTDVDGSLRILRPSARALFVVVVIVVFIAVLMVVVVVVLLFTISDNFSICATFSTGLVCAIKSGIFCPLKILMVHRGKHILVCLHVAVATFGEL